VQWTGGVRVRAGPSTAAPMVITLPADTLLTVLQFAIGDGITTTRVNNSYMKKW
jgi:hypothetical protein